MWATRLSVQTGRRFCRGGQRGRPAAGVRDLLPVTAAMSPLSARTHPHSRAPSRPFPPAGALPPAGGAPPPRRGRRARGSCGCRRPGARPLDGRGWAPTRVSAWGRLGAALPAHTSRAPLRAGTYPTPACRCPLRVPRVGGVPRQGRHAHSFPTAEPKARRTSGAARPLRAPPEAEGRRCLCENGARKSNTRI